MEPNQYPVDVISLSSATGELRPLRLRIQGESRVDIDEVVSTTEIPYVGVEATVFLCRGRSAGRSCLFELKYYLRTHTWWLLRKIY